MNPGDGGLIGGIVGGLCGIACAMVGTYASIKNTHGPRERAFMKTAAVVFWVASLAFLALRFTVPGHLFLYVFMLYAILLPLGIHVCNMAQRSIRLDESQKEPTQRTC